VKSKRCLLVFLNGFSYGYILFFFVIKVNPLFSEFILAIYVTGIY
jgi:hypothetical protein